MYELTNLDDYNYYVSEGLDSFLWDEDQNRLFLIYWVGSLVNNDNSSCATFMNWDIDGLPVHFMLEYSTFTKVTKIDDILISEEVKVLKIDHLNELEQGHHHKGRLHPSYTYEITNPLFLPPNEGYVRQIKVRTPMEGFYKIYILSYILH